MLSKLSTLFSAKTEVAEEADPLPPFSVILEINRERIRQRRAERYTYAHDDEHDRGELAAAAAYYAMFSHYLLWPCSIESGMILDAADACWPFRPEQRNPKEVRNNLIRAGALIVAEIERLDRKTWRDEYSKTIEESNTQSAIERAPKDY